ncbi:MAG: YibE/F family protein [Butyrivibrio sp.]|nr:YibE/F family protein [Butyrivibrio sp.]
MGSVRGKTVSSVNAKWDTRRIVVVGLLVALFVMSYFIIHTFIVTEEKMDTTSHFVKARIDSVLQDNTQVDETTEGVLRGSQEVIVEITSPGEFKGKKYQTSNYLSALFNIDAQQGTKVIVRLDPFQDGYNAFIYSYDRSGVLLFMFAFFAIALVFIGRGKGFMALISLLVTLVSVWGILFPLIEYGFPILLVTVLVVFYDTVFTFALIDGINKKTFSAAVGTLLGVVIASLFAAISGAVSHISGFQTNEAEELLLIGTDHGMHIRGLFTAGIIVASLGAVMDVAMSIASSVHELHEVNKGLSAMELFRSGMNIGRDAMGTMANTLILAFAGSSFTLLLLIYYYNIPFTQLINTDLVAREVIQGISGSIGIVLTVPIVAFLASRVECYEKRA